jgi:hypothetical protein
VKELALQIKNVPAAGSYRKRGEITHLVSLLKV